MYLSKNMINNFFGGVRAGFTLVELLVVIVVIAILASIAVVSYSGIQQRARVSVTKSDLRTIGTTMQLYQADEGAYPQNNTELLDALNRQPNVLAMGVTNTGSYASDQPKSFIYCYSDDGSNIWIAAWKPVTGGSTGAADGDPVYFWSASGLGEAEYHFDEYQAGTSLCSAASEDDSTYWVWSYNPSLLNP